MSPDGRDKIEVGRIDKGGFEDEDTPTKKLKNWTPDARPFQRQSLN